MEKEVQERKYVMNALTNDVYTLDGKYIGKAFLDDKKILRKRKNEKT